MSDKLDAGPYWGNSNLPPKWNEPAVIMVEQRLWENVHRERDELRAENKALEDQAFDLTERLLQCSTESERLRAPKRCVWCDAPLQTQRWISMWFDNREVHCCSEDHLTLWLDTHRAIRDV